MIAITLVAFPKSFQRDYTLVHLATIAHCEAPTYNVISGMFLFHSMSKKDISFVVIHANGCANDWQCADCTWPCSGSFIRGHRHRFLISIEWGGKKREEADLCAGKLSAVVRDECADVSCAMTATECRREWFNCYFGNSLIRQSSYFIMRKCLIA